MLLWARAHVRVLALFSVAIFFAAVAITASAEVSVPPLNTRLTDLTATLTTADASLLEQKLAAFETKKGSQIAVLIIPTTQPEDIAQYAIRVVEQWKLGRKKVDDGVLLLIAKDDRKLRIEVGYGLEGVLPDATVKRIIAETISPKFKQGDFAGGIHAGVDRLMAVIDGETLPPPNVGGTSDNSLLGRVMENIAPILIATFVLAKILQSLFGRFVGSSLMGAGAGLFGWWLFTSVVAAAIVGFLGFIFSLIAYSGRTNALSSRGNRMDSFGGWGGGGFSSSGGGFGGSGGGFGGGGASGGW